MAGAQKNPSWTLAEYAFHLVSGDFTIITDGVTFGLPEITNWVGSNTGINNSDDSNTKGSLGSGRAVIQRPLNYNRTTGDVDEWDSYILSEADTKALNIDIKSVGQKIHITFRHPDWEWENYTVSGTHRPGQQHRKPIQKVYGGVKWLSEIKETIGIDAATATSFNSMIGSDDKKTRVFLDYSHDWTKNWRQVEDGTNADGSTKYKDVQDVDPDIINYWNENNGNPKLKVGDNDLANTYRIQPNVWQNADVRVVTDDGRISYVFIENYIVGKISGLGDNDAINMENVKWDFEAAWAPEVAKWQIAYNMGYSVSWARGDYMAVCPIIGDDDWGNSPSSNYFRSNKYLVQEVPDRENGVVTNVTGNANAYNSSGDILENGTGFGALQLGGKDWIMSHSFKSRVRSFNTNDSTKERTLVLWHGQIVDIPGVSIPQTYCLVIESLIDIGSGWTNRYTDKVEVLLEDGTRKEYTLDKIVGIDDKSAKREKNGESVGKGYYGNNADGFNIGAPVDKKIYYQSAGLTGQDGGDANPKQPSIFTQPPQAPTPIAATNPVVYTDPIGRIDEHLFRYTLDGDNITLYEIPARENTTAAVNGKVSAATSRFDETWGSGTYGLGVLNGYDNTRGILTTESSAMFVKTIDKNSNKTVFNVYHKQAFPGFTLEAGDLPYETLRANISNNDHNPAGPAMRAAYIDASTAKASNVREKWAVALAVWEANQNDKTFYYRDKVYALLAGETEPRWLYCIDNNKTTFGQERALKEDGTPYGTGWGIQKGDVFTYFSEDDSAEKVWEISKINPTYLVADASTAPNRNTAALGIYSADGTFDDANDIGPWFSYPGNTPFVYVDARNDSGDGAHVAAKPAFYTGMDVKALGKGFKGPNESDVYNLVIIRDNRENLTGNVTAAIIVRAGDRHVNPSQQDLTTNRFALDASDKITIELATGAFAADAAATDFIVNGTPAATVDSVVISADGKTATLTLTAAVTGASYTVTIKADAFEAGDTFVTGATASDGNEIKGVKLTGVAVKAEQDTITITGPAALVFSATGVNDAVVRDANGKQLTGYTVASAGNVLTITLADLAKENMTLSIEIMGNVIDTAITAGDLKVAVTPYLVDFTAITGMTHVAISLPGYTAGTGTVDVYEKGDPDETTSDVGVSPSYITPATGGALMLIEVTTADYDAGETYTVAITGAAIGDATSVGTATVLKPITTNALAVTAATAGPTFYLTLTGADLGTLTLGTTYAVTVTGTGTAATPSLTTSGVLTFGTAAANGDILTVTLEVTALDLTAANVAAAAAATATLAGPKAPEDVTVSGTVPPLTGLNTIVITGFTTGALTNGGVTGLTVTVDGFGVTFDATASGTNTLTIELPGAVASGATVQVVIDGSVLNVFVDADDLTVTFSVT
jgi:hypothetical protein